MAQAIAGVAFYRIDGNQFALRGSFKIQPLNLENEIVVGQDSVHGFIQRPVAPFIEGEVSDLGNLALQSLQLVTGATTITAELRNGKTYVLNDAVYIGPAEIDATDGRVTIKFSGSTMAERTAG